MADWTASSNCGIRPYRSPHGSPQIRYYQASTVAASTGLIRAGDVVQFDTANSGAADWRIVRAQSTGGGGANLLSALADKLVGIAIEADTSDGSTTGLGTQTNRQIGVWIADKETEFLAYLRGSGAAASSLVNKQRSLIVDSTLRIWQIDSTNSTAALQTVVITEVPAAIVGDTGAQVVFKFMSSLAAPGI